MSKEANLKNQEKLRVYLEKKEKNDIKSSNNGAKKDSKSSSSN